MAGTGPAAGRVADSAAELPSLSRRIDDMLRIDPDAPALEFDRTWATWGELAASADAVGAQVGEGERVAVLLRNTPAHVGLIVGIARAGACLVVVNPERGADRVAADLAGLGVATLAGTPADLSVFAGHLPGARILSSQQLGDLQVGGRQDADRGELRPGVAVEMLTSGTTGPPKRVPLTYDTMWRVFAGAKHYEGNRDASLRLRSGVAIVNAPLVHLSGLFRVLQCVNDGRSFCLLPKFRLAEWIDAVRRHRPATVSLVPAALRMVLDADIDPADLSSVRSVISGTAPLSADDADAFFEKYGVPVLTSYAATEFGGGVAGWNLADHREFWATKRGSVGRAHAGCALRVVDAKTGEALPNGDEGLLEIRAPQLGDDLQWVRTTDLARLDDDGFLWITGRADQAIIRGGFKVRPDDVRAALESDARVRGAAVIGRDDPRLGAVPIAAVELRDGAGPVTSAQLLDAAATSLARYEVPTELRIVAALPRTPSGKVDLAAVRDLMAEGA